MKKLLYELRRLLLMSFRLYCRNCGGNGWVIVMPNETAPSWYDKDCSLCHGTGRVSFWKWLAERLGR